MINRILNKKTCIQTGPKVTLEAALMTLSLHTQW